MIQQELLKRFGKEKFTVIAFSFSARRPRSSRRKISSTASPIRGRRARSALPLGKRCLVCADNLSMPTKEIYEARSPIELPPAEDGHGRPV